MARDDLHKCAQYSAYNMSGYTTAFHHAASYVVGIIDDKMLDRFVVGLKPIIHKRVLLS